ncbi:MAG: type III secretion system chaperone [Kiritimatiellae bacterium]|nr:type III secretion system chaperone [Kiritimatiellia bacterium]
MDNFKLIRHFGEQLGINLERNPDGAYLFEIDGRAFSIYDLCDCGRIILSGDLGHTPHEGGELLYKTLLEAQYMLESTSGATFSIHPDTGDLTLCKILVPEILDNDSFFREAESFVNALHSWAGIISNFRPEIKTEGDGASIIDNSRFISV